MTLWERIAVIPPCECGLKFCSYCNPEVYETAKPFQPHPRGRIVPDYKSRKMRVTWKYRPEKGN